MHTVRGWFLLPLAVIMMLFMTAGCDKTKNRDFLGSAVVEARTFAVATTAQGAIIALYRDEGQRVRAGEVIALVDTVPLALQKQELMAGKAELGASIAAQSAQNNALQSDVAGIDREFTRIDQLVKKGSAPEQQRDNLGTQLQSSQMRLASSRHTVASFKAKDNSLSIRLAQLEDQLQRCYVRSPVNGVVLTRYRNVGEVAAPGNPFFEIGAFDTLYTDFFVPQTLLASISHDQKIRVRLDDIDPSNGKYRETFIPGHVSWIGSEAEFSPKNIQTRQSRNELVFRIRVTVPNTDGRLKRGLPVEIWR